MIPITKHWGREGSYSTYLARLIHQFHIVKKRVWLNDPRGKYSDLNGVSSRVIHDCKYMFLLVGSKYVGHSFISTKWEA